MLPLRLTEDEKLAWQEWLYLGQKMMLLEQATANLLIFINCIPQGM